jgi:hypothetical protein
MPTTRLPSAAGCTLHEAGRNWDAIRVPSSLGLAAMTILGSRCGAVVEDRGTLYYFVPTGTAAQWQADNTRALGAGVTVTIPPARRTQGPGPHWRITPGEGRWVTDDQALAAALEDARTRREPAA